MHFLGIPARLLFSCLVLFQTILSIQLEDYPREVQRGGNYTIRWVRSEGETNAIGMRLLRGPMINLTQIDAWAAGDGDSYVWTIHNNVVDGDDYILQIYPRSAKSGSTYSGYITAKGELAQTEQPPTSAPTVISSSGSSVGSFSSAPSSAPSSSLVTSLSSPTSILFSTSLPTGDPTSTSASIGGLSVGAKAGIGVGATIAGLGLALGAFLLGLSVQRKNKGDSRSESDGDGLVSEIGGREMYRHETMPEIDSKDTPAELSAYLAPQEVDSRAIQLPPQELDANHTYQPKASEPLAKVQQKEFTKGYDHQDSRPD